MRQSLPTIGAILTLIALGSTAWGTEYFVANSGSDDNDGLSPATAWKTIARVNGHAFAPGDIIRLKRGDSWREALIPCSGSEDGFVTYSAYGEGDKPLLIGSVDKSSPEDWVDEGGGIWGTRPPQMPAAGEDRFPNGDFTEGMEGWGVHTEQGAQVRTSLDREQFASAPQSLRIECVAPGEAGNHIQLIFSPFSIEQGKVYRLAFKARASVPFEVQAPVVMSQGPPWSRYTQENPGHKAIGAEWTTVEQFYTVSQTTDQARLTVYLGARLPAGSVLNLDDFSLSEAEGAMLAADVGNIILNDEQLCGVKVWERDQLRQEGQYWYDEGTHRVFMVCPENPGRHYSKIECALRIHQINQSGKSYVCYENLALKYGAAHGIGGGGTHHIIVRDCDFGWIGGGDQMGGDRTVRFGNGIEFWGNAHDCLVERCRLWEIYDAALTNQNNGPNVVEANIIYRNNLIWNSEYSFEYWNRPENSRTENVQFIHNTCINAGHGWGHAQRPDPSGRHLCFYGSPAPATGIVVGNNVFLEATKNAFYAPSWTREQMDALIMDCNVWYQAEGAMISVAGRNYTMEEFGVYQQEFSKEPGSIAGDPGLVDVANLDLRLRPDSVCIDAAGDTETDADFAGTPRPQGNAPDIGAYEFVTE